MNELVELGVATRPHGIKGGFIFKLINSQDSILRKGTRISINPLSESSDIPKEGKEVLIETIHFGNKTICYLKGIKDRNIVEAMLPFSIHLPRSEFPTLDSGEWYLDDLIGLKVFNLDGYEIGTVESFYDNGAQSVLCLKIESKKLELPFIDAFFPFVDIEKNKIVLNEPEYD